MPHAAVNGPSVVSQEDLDMLGIFSGGLGGLVAGRRDRLLSRLTWYPEPAWLTAVRIPADRLPECANQWSAPLAEQGAVKVLLDRALSNGEFIGLGRTLGELIPEQAPAVRPFVDDDVILNLRTALDATADVDLQPFAENFITLHTESSLQPVAEQPKYLAFTCLVAPEPDSGGQTLLLHMASPADRLDPGDVEVLAQVGYVNGSHPFCRRVDGRLVFCFRDHGETPLRWRCDAAGLSEDRVNRAIEALLLALYDPSDLAGVHWEPETLVVLDNTFLLHGRSRSPRRAAAMPRHIRRLRIRSAGGVS